MPNLTTRRAAAAAALAAALSLGGCATSGDAPTKVTVGKKIADGDSALPSDIKQILMAGGLDLSDPSAATAGKPVLVAAAGVAGKVDPLAGSADPMHAALAAVSPSAPATVRVASLEPRDEAWHDRAGARPTLAKEERASGRRSRRAEETTVAAVTPPSPAPRPAAPPQLVAYAPPAPARAEPLPPPAPEIVGSSRIEVTAAKPTAAEAPPPVVAAAGPKPLKVVAPPPPELAGESAMATKGGRVRRF